MTLLNSAGQGRWPRTEVGRMRLRRSLIELLGGRCSDRLCGWINSDGTRGCSDWRALQVDHVNGGGTREYRSGPESQNLSNVVYLIEAVEQDIRENTGKFQLLCANCNWVKRYENKEHHSFKMPKKRRSITDITKTIAFILKESA